jgi:hypothetical protein
MAYSQGDIRTGGGIFSNPIIKYTVLSLFVLAFITLIVFILTYIVRLDWFFKDIRDYTGDL